MAARTVAWAGALVLLAAGAGRAAMPVWTPPRHVLRHHAGQAGPRDLLVTAFGADPTGVADSTLAIQSAVDAAANISSGGQPRGVGGGRVGVVLEGGTYLISSPIEVGHAVGVSVRQGALVASAAFPSSGFLLNGERAEQLSLETLTLDAGGRGGCLRLDAGLQVTVRDVLFLHFASHGILADDASGMGHKLMVSACFFAEYDWGEPGFDDKASKTGTAVEMRYPDSHVVDSIIRCSRFGVVNAGGSNLFSSLHIYTTCNHDASPANDTVGFLDRGYSTRFLDGYIDTCEAVSEHPGYGLALQNTLFYGRAALRLAPQTRGAPVSGLMVTSNKFTCTPQGCGQLIYDTTNGTVDASSVTDALVADNWFSNASLRRATRVHASNRLVFGPGQTSATVRVSLGDQLLFPLPEDWRGRASASARVVSGTPAALTATVVSVGQTYVSVLVAASRAGVEAIQSFVTLDMSD